MFTYPVGFLNTQTNIFAANTANFNGTTQYFDAGNPAALQITGNITVSIWTKFDTVPSSSEVIMSKFNSASDQRAVLLLYTSGSNTIRASVYTDGLGGSAINVDLGSPPTAGVWIHMVMVYNGSTLKLYIDGSEVDSVSYSSGIFNSTASWLVGSRDETVPDLNLDGSTAFPAIWDNDISSAQVTELCNGGIPICPSDLSAGLKTDLVYAPRLSNWAGNSGDELVDQSTSGITTTNVGSTPFTGTGLTVKCTS